ncbi:hypothetical protein TI10_14570 [Photorhabdus luminescens subsp. luminescens]|nr:hypothetical protein TI10_14525 [Photorhabdus luminescens subsp. luminescens]KMW72639.1 hypothetical protein TI10_14570 [Photorhabdus luminescens subsp. luminescens]
MLKPTAAIAAVRGGSGTQIYLKLLPVSLLRSTALKAGQRAGRGLLPPPQPRCTGCARLAVAGSLLVPVLAISAPCSPQGLPRRKASPAGLAGPHPANPRQRRRQAAPPSRVPDKTRFRQENGASTRC